MDARIDWRDLTGLAIGVAAAVGTIVVRGKGWIDKGLPSFDAPDLLVSLLAAIAAIAVFPLALRLERRRSDEQLDMGGSMLIVVTISLAALAMLLLLTAPGLFSYLLEEDQPAEWLSAICLFAGALALTTTVIVKRPARPTTLALLVATAVLLLLGFEEVSWFQRVIGLETPGWLAGSNAQKELNFHNVSTWATEQLYYVGAFALCVLGRFASDIIGFPSKRLMPSLAILAAGAIACGLNYDTWRTAPLQTAFFVALALICASALATRPQDRWRALLLWTTAATLALTQTGFIAFGHLMPRIAEEAELRELMIAMALFAYAMQVATRVWRTQSVGAREFTENSISTG